MKHSIKIFIWIFLVLTVLLSYMSTAQSIVTKDVKWKTISPFASFVNEQNFAGLSGIYCGVHHDVMLIAGGSNFPSALPWNGGKKKYWNAIYALVKTKDAYKTILLKDTLHKPLAYGASISTKNGIFCFGGENDNGAVNDCFLLQWNDQTKSVFVNTLPSLPMPLSNLSACEINSTIYLVGGDNGKTSFSYFLSISLNEKKPVWKVLPSLPDALSYTVTVAQNNGKENCVYVIGGRCKTDSGISKLSGTVFCFKPSANHWERKSDLFSNNEKSNLSAASGVSVGKDNILLLGGDNGVTFSKIEKLNYKIGIATNNIEKEKLTKEKIELLNNHQGFNKTVWLYNTFTDEWKKLSEMPYSPVTTIAVKWNDKIFIPFGEIKPGVRTSTVLIGNIITN